MTTPVRLMILDNIGATLGAISIANGFRTDVAKVQAIARGYADVKTGERPFLGYVPESETTEYQPFHYLRCVLTVRVVGHVSGVTQSDRAIKLNGLIDDLLRALSKDPTRGGNAISSKVSLVQTDEGDPDAHGDGSLLLTVAVTYERVLDGP